jgi:uncharacterized membrane protein
VNLIAAIRPDDWNIALLVHVLGAMVLIGALVLAASALFFAWRDGTATSVRLGFRVMLLGALPAWIVMRVGAEWIASKEGLEDADIAWVNMGFTTADIGFLFILVTTLLVWLATRRAAAAPGPAAAPRSSYRCCSSPTWSRLGR